MSTCSKCKSSSSQIMGSGLVQKKKTICGSRCSDIYFVFLLQSSPVDTFSLSIVTLWMLIMIVKVLREICAGGLFLLDSALKSAITRVQKYPHRLLLKASMLTLEYVHPSVHLSLTL